MDLSYHDDPQPCRHHLLDESGFEPDEDVDITAGDEDAPGDASERVLCCAVCVAPITRRVHARAVFGQHEHDCVNQVGEVFHIGTFGRAEGCAVYGEATGEFSWFAGYRWRFAACGQCGAQLGWFFEDDGEDAFFGLILDRLVEVVDEGAS